MAVGWMLDRRGYAPVWIAAGTVPLIAWLVPFLIFDRRRGVIEPHAGGPCLQAQPGTAAIASISTRNSGSASVATPMKVFGAGVASP